MNDERFAVGIDLGTSTSEICVFRDGQPVPIVDPSSPAKSAIVPSLVAVTPRGELVVGEAARNIVDAPGRGAREFKRIMGDGGRVILAGVEHRPEEIAALLLRQLKDNAEVALGRTVREVVLSVPANFPDSARQATLDAGKLAGLEILRLINEPTAAALAFGVRHLEAEETLAVFDFGGGTLDVTVLEMMEGVMDARCSQGDSKLGGADFDAALVELILAKFRAERPGVAPGDQVRRRLKNDAERAKIALSCSASHVVSIPNFASSDGELIDLEVEVTRAEFERAVAPLVARARAALDATLKTKAIAPESVSRVLLVGGTTYIPCVRTMVAEFFGREPRTDVSPDLAVGMGASISAAIATGLLADEKALILTDVSPFGLGVPVLQRVGGQPMLVYDELIAPNQTIPYSVQREYSLISEDQEAVEISLFQDPTGRAQLPEQAIFTGIAGEITDIPPAIVGGPHELRLDFSYDANGIVNLTATIPATRQQVAVQYKSSPARMGESELAQAKRQVDELWKKSPKAKEHASVIAKAERMLPGLAPQPRAELTTLLLRLKGALAEQDVEAIDDASSALVDKLFSLDN
ncbi:MAG: Hsp70 family protein [Candidatus Polarisedimenticolia bacterium]